MPSYPPILLISGSLRQGSTNSAVLRTVAGLAGDVPTVTFSGLADLPHFNPDDDREPLPPAVVALRRAIAGARALLFCTPEYAGDLPGSLKNLLDWTVGGVEIEARPTGWINVSTSPGGAAETHRALARVLGYTGAHLVGDACVDLPVPRAAIGGDGIVHDPALRARLAAVVRSLVAPSDT
jgi:chromate reductase